MTNPARNRFAVDLGEIERQLARSASQPQPTKNDPLAELARIVGQDDPFRSILKAEATSPQRGGQPADLDQLFDSREERSAAPRPLSFQDHLAQPAYAHPAYASDGRDAGRYAEDRTDGPGIDWDPYYAEPAAGEAPLQPRARRKGLVTIAAVLGVAALGAGAAMVVGSDGMKSLTGGEPPVIKAETAPLKVQPQNPGGVEIPNQNKQIYERAAQGEKTRVVNREEQPLDVQQAARQTPRVALPNPAPQAPAQLVAPVSQPLAAAPATSPSATSALGEPRRVRTVSVRPDGTIVANDASPVAPPPAPRPSPVPTMSMPAVPAPVPAPAIRPTQQAAAPAAAPAPRPAASTPEARPAPQRVASVETPRAPAAPAPAPAVKEQQRLAALPQAAETAAAADTAGDGPSGGYAIQLGVRGTEAQARAAFNEFRSRVGDALGGASAIVRKAEVKGNTVFRVRAGPMTQSEANAACAKVKAAGGDCFVAKN